MHAMYLTALLGAMVAAAPSLAPRTTSAQIDKFDDLTATPGVAVNQVGNNGLYNRKVYRGFALADNRVPANLTSLISNIVTRPGVSPSSGTNQIAWGTTDLQTLLNGQALIDTNYPGTTVKYIELKKLRYGCSSASKASEASVPTTCEITLRCNRADGTQVSQTFTNFKIVGTQTRAPQVDAVPMGFTNCISVKFDNPRFPGLLAVGTALAGLADNIEMVLTTV